MLVFPNAKINLGLKVLGKCPDGYHNIETIFYPMMDLCDVLEIIEAADGVFAFETTGLHIPGDPDSNLCVKACRMLTADFQFPPVKIHLHKIIPTGSGLGGGSSDAAFTIRLLDELFAIGLVEDQRLDYARKLGSDCAFFILNRPVLATGKGDQFMPVEVDLSKYRIEIISPGIHVNTMEAYAMIDSLQEESTLGNVEMLNLKELIIKPVFEWKDLVKNDFEDSLFFHYPELAKIKQQLYEKGALYASMTGSGSAVYGIFLKE